MPDGKDPERKRTGGQGGLQSWANTDARGERYERMARVRDKSPASDTYWARKLGFDPEDLTPKQRNEIKTQRKLYFAKLRVGSAKAIQRAKARRLRQRADAIEAAADRIGDGDGAA